MSEEQNKPLEELNIDGPQLEDVLDASFLFGITPDGQYFIQSSIFTNDQQGLRNIADFFAAIHSGGLIMEHSKDIVGMYPDVGRKIINKAERQINKWQNRPVVDPLEVLNFGGNTHE